MKRSLLLTFLLTLLLALPSHIFATHIMGADLSYKYMGRDISNHMVYKVTLTFYRACCNGCSTSGPSNTLSVKNSCTNVLRTYTMALEGCPNGCEVNYLCLQSQNASTCNNSSGSFPGCMKYTDTTTIVLTDTCSNWIVSWTDGNRNGSISNLVNPLTQSVYLQATINNSIDPSSGSNYINSSPSFIKAPDAFLCLNTFSPYVITASTLDIDGDSLTYKLIDPLTTGALPIAHSGSYTATAPISNSYFNFDSTTGIIAVVPSQIEMDIYTVLVSEYRKGILVGTIMRDIETQIYSCSSQVPVIEAPHIVQGGFLSADSNTIYACPGSDLVITIPAHGNLGTNLTVTSDILRFPQIFTGMTYTVSGLGLNATALVEWAHVDTGCRYISIEATADDCPIQSINTRILKLCGKVGSHISPFPSSHTYCGQAITLTGDGGLNPHWWPSSGLSDTVHNVTHASPSASTMYYFSTSCGTDSIYVPVASPPSYTMAHDTAICDSGSAQLWVAVSSGLCSYHWSPAYGLYDALSSLPNNNIPNPVVRISGRQLYHCYITDSTGCVVVDSVRVLEENLSGFHVSATPVLIPLGSGTSLTVNTNFPNVPLCSTIPAAGTTQYTQVQIGTGGTTQPPVGSAYPSPYGNYYKSARHQMLFKSSELRAMLGNGRIISSFSVQIGRFNSGSNLLDFTIKMACVNIDSLTGYVNANLQTVYQHNYSSRNGWNTHTFDNPYVWDGISDLVVDLCFSDTSTSNFNSQITYTTTPFRSIWCTYGNAISMCGITGSRQTQTPAYATYFQRPNAMFGLANWTGSTNIVDLQWQPSTGSNSVTNQTANPTSASPQSSQWYTASISDPQCHVRDSVFVTVYSSLMSAHNPDTTFCGGVGVPFSAHGGSLYSWTDATGSILSTDSTFTLHPTASTSVYLHITDIIGGSYYDTTYVTVPTAVTISPTDTTVYASGSMVAIHASAASIYSWSAGGSVISTGSSVLMSVTQDSIIILDAGISTCSFHDTCRIHLITTANVWPGDANNDRIADNTDIISIGQAYGSTGAVRVGASLVWAAQAATPWSCTFGAGINCVYADCNGDGVVDANDTLAVYQNFGLTHTKTDAQRQGQYPITITTDKNLYGPNDTMKVTLSLADNTVPVQSIYGIAYRFDVATVAGSRIVKMKQVHNSWMGNGLTFERLSGSVTAYLAQSRISHRDTTGYGIIAEIDVVNDAVVNVLDSVFFSVSHITARTIVGDTVTFSAPARAVTVSQYPLGIDNLNEHQNIELYPNPNTGSFSVVQAAAVKTKMIVTDELGRVIYEMNLTDKITSVDMGKVPTGIYTATFTSAAMHMSKRVVVRR